MAEVQLDKITYYIMLWNFASVGVLTSLCWRAPTLLKHSQLVVLAALCAYWFTFIPPWTTWLILLSLVRPNPQKRWKGVLASG
jgi:presenilin 1